MESVCRGWRAALYDLPFTYLEVTAYGPGKDDDSEDEGDEEAWARGQRDDLLRRAWVRKRKPSCCKRLELSVNDTASAADAVSACRAAEAVLRAGVSP